MAENKFKYRLTGERMRDRICTDKKAVWEIMKWIERNIESENRRFFLFMLPEHGNLGDYAIGYAEFAFFKQYFYQYNVYGITTSEWLGAEEFYKKLIKPNDVIFINGGGYLGDLWGISEIYEHMIESFPLNIKIFFPNTLTYQEKPDENNESFMEDMKWFQKQKNLFVFFRESVSFQSFYQYEKRCSLFPDMAFYLSCERNDYRKKNKVLLCLRNDCEKIFESKNELVNKLKDVDIDYDIYDICMGKYISQQKGKELLQQTIQLFQSYDCIITDRLHGMILAAVSNVPCIAFNNRTHKIRGVFETIQDFEYVKLITEDEISSIDEIIRAACEKKLNAGAYRPPTMEFERMAGKIREIMNSVKAGEIHE